jgi:hypothetical protein
MDNINHYEDRLDRIFGEGNLWKHRTFRTVFDPYSHEWYHTSIDEKVRILKRFLSSGEQLSSLIGDYKDRYESQNRRDISAAVEDALTVIMQYQLQNDTTSIPVLDPTNGG